MDCSANIGQLAAALAAAQAALGSVTKDRDGDSRPDMATVVRAIKEALGANGLAVFQPVRTSDGEVLVTTLLAHSSGEWMSEEMRWPVVSADNRSISSEIAYARRCSLLAMVGADTIADTVNDGDAVETATTSEQEIVLPPLLPKRAPKS